MPNTASVLEHFDIAVQEAALNRDRAHSWVVFRTADYWLWGIDAGLTQDPQRSQRLMAALLD